jgi:Na+-driven multidrug efflux pump
VRLPIAYIASQYVFGARGIWMAFFVSNVFGAVLAWLWFRRGTWRDGDVRGTPGPGSGGIEADDADIPASND